MSYSISTGAVESNADLLLSYSTITIASHHTIILIITLTFFTPKSTNLLIKGTLAATFAELTTHETKDLMNRLFSGRPEGYWAALSYQLHLSEEKVVEEINRFLKNFEQSVKFKEQTPLFPPKEGSDSDISTATPKANHSTRR